MTFLQRCATVCPSRRLLRSSALLYIFYGEDNFRLQEALHPIKAQWDAGEMLDLNTTRLEGERLSLAELKSVCDAAPFLSEKRLVLIEGLLSRFENGREQRKGRSADPEGEALCRNLAAYAPCIPQSTILILIDGPLRGGNPLLKTLSPWAEVKEFRPLRGAELNRWLVERVGGAGGSITPGALRLMTDFVGNDLWVLSAEIEKLILYSGGRIGEEEVRLLVPYVREANIFQMVDALVEGRPAQALREMHRLLEEGASPQRILAMITRQFRLIFLARDLEARGLRPPEVQQRLGLPSSYVFEKTVRQARMYSFSQLEKTYQQLLEVDLAAKTGRWEPSLGLDLLILDLCRGRRYDRG